MTTQQQIHQLAESLGFIMERIKANNIDDWGFYDVITREIHKVHEVFVDTLEED